MPSKLYRANFSTKITVKSNVSKQDLDSFRSGFAAASDSMEHLKLYLPSVDKSKNPDLLSVAFDSSVINLVNGNDDGITTKPALKMLESIPFKFINVEHMRSYIVGVTTSYGMVSLLEKKELQASDLYKENPNEEQEGEAEESPEFESLEPFYLCVGGVIWKTVDPYLTDMLEEANNSNSSFYKEFATSWEIGFDKYSIALGSKKLKDAKIISSEDEIKEMSKYLRCNGGSGFLEDGTPVYRVITDDEPIFYGIGITSTPAAAVSGILTASINNFNKNKEIISQPEKVTVIKNDMKINDISDITEDSLKEMQASTIRDFIKSQVRTKSDELSAEIQVANTEKDRISTELESYKVKASGLESTTISLQSQLEQIQNELSSLKASQEAAEKAEKFNLRLQSLSEDFNLTDESRQIVASQINDLSDEAFESWRSNFAILTKVPVKEKASASDNTEAATTIVASAKAVASAIPNSQEFSYDRFKKAFELKINKGTISI